LRMISAMRRTACRRRTRAGGGTGADAVVVDLEGGKAGDQPEQARFAAAVGTPNVQRFTAVKMKVKPLEQQPPASDKRKIFGVEQLHA